MVVSFPVAAAATVMMHLGEARMLDCDLRGPGGTQFDLHGTFDQEELRTNIADWPGLSLPTDFQGGLRLSVENLVHHYEWSGPRGGSRGLKVQMVEYGRQNVAVLTILDHFSDDRHSVDALVGTGLCETRLRSSHPEDDQ